MKKLLIVTQLLFQLAYSDIYNDRMLVYIDNSIGDFQLNETIGRTNIKELNDEMDRIGANGISQWLPSARPTDRDGDISLNR